MGWSWKTRNACLTCGRTCYGKRCIFHQNPPTNHCIDCGKLCYGKRCRICRNNFWNVSEIVWKKHKLEIKKFTPLFENLPKLPEQDLSCPKPSSQFKCDDRLLKKILEEEPL